MLGLTTRASVKAVGTAAVLVVALVVFYLIARLNLDPWQLKLVVLAVPAAPVLAGIVWILSGGEQGTHIEAVDGARRVTITNANVFARTLARTALEAFARAPLPAAAGTVTEGSPADPRNVIEGPAPLPATVEVTAMPIDVPPGAGRLS